MARGDAHSYLIALNKGQYLRAVAAQRGVDIVLTLLGPDGAEIVASDRWRMIEGSESVSAVAEVEGDYHLEVRASNEKAATGMYEIRIETLGEATREDRHRVAAERVYAEGERYYRYYEEWWSEPSLQTAIKKYEEAAALHQLAKDPCGEADVLTRIAEIYNLMQQYSKGLEYCDRALALTKSVGDCRVEIDRLMMEAVSHSALDDHRKGLEQFDRALEFSRAAADRYREGWTLQYLGARYLWRNEAQKALHYFSQSLALAEIIEDLYLEAHTHNNFGLAYWKAGEYQKSLEAYHTALPLWRALGNLWWATTTLDNMGLTYEAMGEHQKALDAYAQTLAVRRATGHKSAEADTLTGMSKIHIALKEPYKALDHLNRALSLYEETGNREGQAYALRNTGKAYALLGEHRKALDYYARALPIDRELKDMNEEAEALYGLARAHRDLNEYGLARARIEESLSLIESLRNRLTSEQLSAAYFASKRGYYEFYIDLLMRMHRRNLSGGYDRQALAASERARARGLLDLLAEARIDIRQGIAPALKQRERDLQSRLSAVQSRLIQAHSRPSPQKDEIARLEMELKKAESDRDRLEIEIRQRHPQYAEIHYPAPLQLEEIQQLLDDRSALLEYSLGEEASYLFVVTSKDFLALELSASRALVDRVRRLRQSLAGGPLRTALATYLHQARELYRELIEPAENLIAGKRELIVASDGSLHYLPFEVLLPQLGERPGDLSHLPYLVRDYAISYIPSASILASLRRDRHERTGAKGMFLAFADPLYGRLPLSEKTSAGEALRSAFGKEKPWQLERLEESRREVARIAELYPDQEVSLFLGERAREEEVKTGEILSRYRFIHFAVHGLLNENKPSYSGLVLSLPVEETRRKGEKVKGQKSESLRSPPDFRLWTSDLLLTADPRLPTSEDGLLQVFEIFNLKLNADLVVLSACETGLGKQVRGEGLIGLTRAFLYAGSRSVVVSLWKVADRSTAELMARFYKHLNEGKSSKAEAMRQAQLEIISESRFAHPYYWAPFVLIGQP